MSQRGKNDSGQQPRDAVISIKMKTTIIAIASVGLLLACTQPVRPQEVAQGRALAERLCSGCHAIAGAGPSPVAQAPPFSRLGHSIDIDSLAEALAEGILTGHGPVEMPEFVLSPEEIDGLLAFLHSVQK